MTYIKVKKQKKRSLQPKYPFMHDFMYDDIAESDHASLTSAGYAKCMDAHVDFRKRTEPLICDKITKFSKQYEIIPKSLLTRSEFFEIKRCKDKLTGDFKGVKVFRKAELT